MVRAGSQKNTVAVANENKRTSMIFLTGVFTYFFLSRPNLVLTKIKNAPAQPVMTPMMILFGRSDKGEITWSTVPNLRAEAELSVTISPL